MARWPDNLRANLIAAVLIFLLTPALCWLAWWWLRG